MKGFECKKCGGELRYEQVCGMRIVHEGPGETYYYSTYCPVCKEYGSEEKTYDGAQD